MIRGGQIADGSRRALYRADVAVKGDRISAIGDLHGVCAKNELDAEGLIVAPGFIDAHSHSDTSFLRDSSCASKLYQGVTTEVTGQCGSSPFPAPPEKFGEGGDWGAPSFEEFVKRFDRENYQMATNQAMLVGHSSLRAAVMGLDDRPATGEEIGRMIALLRRDMAFGAWGMSLGLEYAPGFFADARELTSLGETVAAFDGTVTCHMRSEGLKIDEAIGELLNIGRESGVRVHVSHLKIDNFRVHGQAERVWEILENAKKEGVRVSADMYPYVASCTTLTIRCPKWSREGGTEALLGRLNSPLRAKIVEGIREHYFSAERAETCLLNDDDGFWPEIVGRTLRDVAENDLRTTDYAEAAAQVLEKTSGGAGCIFFVMSESDMLAFLSHDIGIGTDGWALSGDPAKVSYKPHPRSYGAIAEFFRLAREKNLCPVEEAVRRVTSKAADMISLPDRGRLKTGAFADITVFDPAKIAPRATYLAPVRLAEGVKHVIVNGEIALQDGKQTDYRSGRFLRKTVRL